MPHSECFLMWSELPPTYWDFSLLMGQQLQYFPASQLNVFNTGGDCSHRSFCSTRTFATAINIHQYIMLSFDNDFNTIHVFTFQKSYDKTLFFSPHSRLFLHCYYDHTCFSSLFSHLLYIAYTTSNTNLVALYFEVFLNIYDFQLIDPLINKNEEALNQVEVD